MKEGDDHVRDLHARIIDVILHFHAPAGPAQQAHKRIAQRGVAQVADVRGFIRIDVGVFDDAFRRVGRGGRRGFDASVTAKRKERGARKNRNSRSRRRRFPRARLPRWAASCAAISCAICRGCAFQPLGQLEADGRGDFAHLDAGRFLRDNGHVLLVVLADVRRERGANAGYENVNQVAPICEEN